MCGSLAANPASRRAAQRQRPTRGSPPRGEIIYAPASTSGSTLTAMPERVRQWPPTIRPGDMWARAHCLARCHSGGGLRRSGRRGAARQSSSAARATSPLAAACQLFRPDLCKRTSKLASSWRQSKVRSQVKLERSQPTSHPHWHLSLANLPFCLCVWLPSKRALSNRRQQQEAAPPQGEGRAPSQQIAPAEHSQIKSDKWNHPFRAPLLCSQRTRAATLAAGAADKIEFDSLVWPLALLPALASGCVRPIMRRQFRPVFPSSLATSWANQQKAASLGRTADCALASLSLSLPGSSSSASRVCSQNANPPAKGAAEGRALDR